MNLIKSFTRRLAPAKPAIFLSVLAATTALAQTNIPVLTVQADHVTAKMPTAFYGLMTEEINYSYEGGLYGELIRNRTFKADEIQEVIKPENYDPAKYYPVKLPSGSPPKFWTAINSSIMLDTNQPLNEMLNVSLKLDTSKASKATPAGIANSGYWGIPGRPNTTYHASFFAKTKDFSGPLTLSLESADGKTVYAHAEVSGVSGGWKKYEATLTTGDLTPSKENRFVLSTTKPGTFFHHDGTVWLQEVSLMPPTYNDRVNGNRPDLSQLLADAQPKFLRFPGGNFVEGDYFNERFNWKQTIGPLEQRPGHRSCWGYWATDGFGLPEFLGWCEDLHMQPVLAVFAGYTLRHDVIPAGPKLEPYVQEALEEIEYVTGDAATTKWGAQRAKDGHPNPLNLRYVEIGNEDWFDRSGSYDGRFAQFYDAIKAKYPQLKLISTADVKSRTADLNDEHYYKSEQEMESQAYMYDKRDRSVPTKIFVGEWATRVGSPTPNMAGALGDAAWMCCLERNADIVMMHCYAPLFVNVSDLKRGGSMQWPSDLIGYDALNSYGSPSYYAQKIFSLHQGDEVLGTEAQNLPTYAWIQNGRTRNGTPQPARTNEVKSLFYSATRDTASGKIIVKVVNRADAPQDAQIQISGVSSIDDAGTATVLKADDRNQTNTIDDPKHVVPTTENVTGLGMSFTRTYPPCSITILELSAK